VASAVTFLVNSQLGFASWIRLIVGVVVFVFVVAVAAVLTRAISQSDIGSLGDMTSSLGFVGRLLNKFLGFMEKLMKMLKT
jgi:hypothetical protein